MFFLGALHCITSYITTLRKQGFSTLMTLFTCFCLHYVFLPRINHSLSVFKDAWNCHPLSTERNLSPLQLWMAGLAEQQAVLQAEVSWSVWYMCRVILVITYFPFCRTWHTTGSIGMAHFQTLRKLDLLKSHAYQTHWEEKTCRSSNTLFAPPHTVTIMELTSTVVLYNSFWINFMCNYFLCIKFEMCT